MRDKSRIAVEKEKERMRLKPQENMKELKENYVEFIRQKTEKVSE